MNEVKSNTQIQYFGKFFQLDIIYDINCQNNLTSKSIYSSFDRVIRCKKTCTQNGVQKFSIYFEDALKFDFDNVNMFNEFITRYKNYNT